MSVRCDDYHLRLFLFLSLGLNMRFDLRFSFVCKPFSYLHEGHTSLLSQASGPVFPFCVCDTFLHRWPLPVRYFISCLSFLFFLFLLIIRALSNLSFMPGRSICWGQTLWFFSFTSGRDNIQGWKARYLQWISAAARGLASAAALHHHCQYVLFCTMSYLLIYSTCPRLPLTSYLAH